MKTKFLLLSLTLTTLLMSCLDASDHKNNKKANDWIQTHKHPIICIFTGTKSNNGHILWTLISKDGQVYATGPTELLLPDTIK